MKSPNKNTLIWIIVILVVINLSTAITIIYHAYIQPEAAQKARDEKIEIPDSRLGRFFRYELNLNPEQHQQFRQFRQEFHADANTITAKMRLKRKEFVLELGKEKSDTAYLHTLSKEIGNLHEDLKNVTFEYYLKMKKICDKEQKEKLLQIFNSMLYNEARMKMPVKKQNNYQE